MLEIEQTFGKHFDRLLKGTSKNSFAIALSGGLDSSALYALVKSYCSEKITAIYANHHLRPESNDEAAIIKEKVQTLGDDFIQLSWQEAPKTGIQAKARAWRYSKMTELCKQRRINILLTGHHQDDQLEGYLMRKQRKSGAFGQSQDLTYYSQNDVLILRPLLPFSKQQLRAYLKAKKISWLEDKSNNSVNYQRNRQRRAIANMQVEEHKTLLKIMLQQQKTSAKLAVKLRQLLIGACMFEDNGSCIIDLRKLDFSAFDFNKLDLTVQLFSYLLAVIGGQNEPPRYRSLNKLLARFQQPNNFTATLNGTKIIKRDKNLLFYRELKPASLSITLTKEVWFDNRFLLKFSNKLLNHLGPQAKLCNLSFDDYVANKQNLLGHLNRVNRQNHYPKNMLFTFPVIKKLEKIVAIPHISYYDTMGLEDLEPKELASGIECWFKPCFYSRYLHI